MSAIRLWIADFGFRVCEIDRKIIMRQELLGNFGLGGYGAVIYLISTFLLYARHLFDESNHPYHRILFCDPSPTVFQEYDRNKKIDVDRYPNGCNWLLQSQYDFLFLSQ